MVVAFHRFSESRLFVMAALDMLLYGFVHAGRLISTPGRIHILPKSPRPLPVQPFSSDGNIHMRIIKGT